VLLPFLISGSFIILGGVSLLALITGIILFIIVTNINIGGSAGVATVNTGLTLGLNSEGGYSLFVIFIGSLFYLGAQLTIIITPLLTIFTGVINAIFGAISWVTGSNLTSLQTSLGIGGNTTAPNLGNIYPLTINIAGISLFGTLDVLFASMFILSLYFMVSSRGQ
jgi:hypothetical protein